MLDVETAHNFIVNSVKQENQRCFVCLNFTSQDNSLKKDTLVFHLIDSLDAFSIYDSVDDSHVVKNIFEAYNFRKSYVALLGYFSFETGTRFLNGGIVPFKKAARLEALINRCIVLITREFPSLIIE